MTGNGTQRSFLNGMLNGWFCQKRTLPCPERKWRLFKVRFAKADMQQPTP